MKIFNNIRSFKKLSFIVVAFGCMTISSCNKILDVQPTDVTREDDFLRNYWDAEFMLRGAYQALQPLIEYKFVLGEVRADWTTPGSGADNDIKQLASHTVTGKNRYTDWSYYYDLINRANYVIENVGRVPRDPNFFSEAIMQQYMGEARFLRCWGYFNLVMNFGDVPFIWTAVDDITKVPYLAPTSQEIILDSLEKDLKIAYQATVATQIMVPNTFDIGLRESAEQTVARATKAAVGCLQAELYLYRNKYSEVVTVCDAVSNLGRWNNFGSAGANWFLLFTAVTNYYNEPILQVLYRFDTRETSKFMELTSNDPLSGGLYKIAPSLKAMKTYNPSYPDSTGTVNTTTEIYRGFGVSVAGSAPYYNRLKSDPVIWKYIGLGTVQAGTTDVPVNVRLPYRSEGRFHLCRQSDYWLYWAEALNRLGEKATAIARVNTIRSRAGMPAPAVTINNTTEEIEDYILRERAIELGFEGRRWYDLLRVARRGRPRVLIDAVKSRAAAAEQAYLETHLSDPKNWYLPFNDEEKKLNPNL